ncbi:VPS13A_C [Mytilus coruscus]|uniref:VPS13A_C n=1 Tax=Mytilus coruscus TaxID=42192 RepID=A0A6J8DCH7_MYTCO|nr:VPS13A_C [Mytilus coruscus]
MQKKDGDAVLQNLDLKESALDDLDLPVKIKAGHIGKLTLKIPWKNLYTEPVVATIDGLYALAVPNVAVKYNEEKEEKAKQESKQKKLQQIEDAKKLEAEKDKPKEVKKDSFAEKMAAQIIKNLQVQVMNVHVRYEDKYSNPKRPFSIGVSLKELLFQTTDENWKPCVIKEAVTQIFKLIKLDSLAVYWNPNSEQFDGKDKATVLSKLTSGVADSEKDPGFQYLIKPISSVAHLRLNTKPELNKYTIPKIFMTIVFDDISVGLSKLQFDDVLEMLESLERMNLLNKYRKYRPDVPHKNHAKQWWHYAMNSVLEEDIRNRRKMWSWSYINQHRRTMKQYREAYVKQLDGKKVSKVLQKTLDDCEKVLNVFSITLMRQQAEVEAAKLGAKKAQEKGSGWFGGWLGGKKKSGEKKEDIKDKYQEQFTPEEKSKLYDAIGYEENEGDPTLPKEFVALRLVTKLTKMSITLRDDASKDSHVIKLQLKDVFSSVGQRPAANAIMVEAKMDKFTVQGTLQNGQSPYMALSQTKEADQVYSLLNAWFENNPVDGACDTRVRLNSRPLQIIYDAVTINNLVKFFKPPEDVYLQQLSEAAVAKTKEAAVAKFEQIKEQSVTGLQHAIEQRKYTEISVNLQPSYVIIPDKGYYRKDGKALILDLGNLKVATEKNQSKYTKGQQMETVEELMKRAYDRFNITLGRVQVLFSISALILIPLSAIPSGLSLLPIFSAVLLNILGVVILLVVTCLAGIVVFAYYNGVIGCDPLANGDVGNENQIIPLFVMKTLACPGLPGTMSSCLNSLAAVTWEDILKPFWGNISEDKKIWVTRILGCGIGMAFMAMNLGGTVLQASLSFTGAASGPLLGIFVLGAFFPWANWIGAVIGSILGFVLPMWISIGAYSVGGKTNLPTNTSLCYIYHQIDNSTSSNVTSAEMNTTVMPEESSGISDLYKVSYLWYPSIGAATVVVVGMIVSAVTGFTRKSDVDPKYLIPLFDRIFWCLPSSFHRCLRCYTDFQDPEDIKEEETTVEFTVDKEGNLYKEEQPSIIG